MTRFPSDAEIVDGEPVAGYDPLAVATQGRPAVAATRPLSVRPVTVGVPARRAAALAATGFVAGAATVAVASRRAPGRFARRTRRGRKGVVGEILSSNSFLVDVHLVRRG